MSPTTRRLILRPPTMSDMPAFLALLNDYDVAKHLVGFAYPFTEAMFWEFLQDSVRGRGARTGFDFAVTRALDGALVGLCSVGATEPDRWEFGYWYGKRYWNQGYATEAGRVVLRFALERLEVEKIVTGWFVDNPASGHVLTKLGFRPTGFEMRYCLSRDRDVKGVRMELTRDDFARMKAA